MTKLKSDKHYALLFLKDSIENLRYECILEYILYVWKEKPNLRKREILNSVTIEYLNQNKRGKNEKNNIVKLYSSKLN